MESVKNNNDQSGRTPFRWVSSVAYKTVPKIVSRGYNTTEIVEKGYGLADMIFINYQSRIPLLKETELLNYVMVVNVDGGLDNSAAMGRYCIKGEPYVTQACGAGILAFGPAYGAIDALGNMLVEYINRAKEENLSTAEAAKLCVEEKYEKLKSQGKTIIGVSELDIKNPTPKRMFAKAEQLGLKGENIEMMEEIVKAVKAVSDQEVDLDLLGATTACMQDLKFSPESAFSIIAVIRGISAGAHAIEEQEREDKTAFGQPLTPKETYDGPEDKAVPSLEERKNVTVANNKMVGDTLESWYKNLLEKQKNVATGWAIQEEVPFLKELEEKKQQKQEG